MKGLRFACGVVAVAMPTMISIQVLSAAVVDHNDVTGLPYFVGLFAGICLCVGVHVMSEDEL